MRSITRSFDKVSSTNDKVKELLCHVLDPGNKILVVKSMVQTKGKGRLDRRWQSGKGGAWFSFGLDDRLIEKSGYYGRQQLLSFVSSLSVYEVLDGIKVKNLWLKWPNDVYVLSKKICGILLEKFESGVIVGIGINVNNDMKEVSGIATSIRECGIRMDVDDLIERVVEKFKRNLLLDKGHILDSWKKKSKIGKKVRLETLNGAFSGTYLDVDEKGRIVIEVDNQKKKFIEGDIV